MHKSTLYSQEQNRSFDHMSVYNDALTALGVLMADILFGSAGGTLSTVLGGFGATPGTGLTINLAAGSLYQLAALDGTAWGAMPANAAQVVQQGLAAAQAVVLTAAALISGQSQWVLIEATFGQVDAIRTGDPNSGIAPFVNAANPTGPPLQGPGGSGGTLPSVRQGVASIRVLYGGPATTGAETPPNPDAGYVPLYLVDLAFGQTTITQNQIIIAQPSVVPNGSPSYAYAPFLSRLVGDMVAGTATPVLAVGSGAGTGPPAPILILGSTDSRGMVKFGTGTGPTTGVQVTVTFANPRKIPPVVVLTPLNNATALLSLNLSTGGTLVTGFSVALATAPAASQAASTYGFSYAVLGA
jgi:hypothetical protein